MPLILAGIDEAGYGPTLGPLCVGLSVFEVPHDDGAPPPCLWKLLSRAICREAGRGGKPGPGNRIPIADSKQLKLSSSVVTTHPLVHLERGVLCMLNTLKPAFAPSADLELFDGLGSTLPRHPCYSGDPTPLPCSHDAGQLAISANVLRRAMTDANVRTLAMRCRVMDEHEFNTLATEADNKGATTAAAVSGHLRTLWETYAPLDDAGRPRLGVVCDRLGGRAMYGDLLRRALPGATVTILEESETRSRYVVEDTAARRRMGVSFLVEAEQAHMPVALASMIAKYTRELCMARFNRSWEATARNLAGLELKHTAGYAQDARRWLHDARAFLNADDRAALVRRY